MRQSRADDAQALMLAVALHVMVFVLMFAGLWWTRTPRTTMAAGAPASAELVNADDLSDAMQRTLAERPDPAPAPAPLPEPVQDEAAPLPQPLPEPVPEVAPTPVQSQAQDFIPEPDTRAQEAVVDQPTPRPADDTELREARRRQEQIDLTEQKRQEEVQRQQRLAKMELERQAQLADIRRRRAAAAREAEAAEQRLQQVAEARAAKASASVAAVAPPGNFGSDTGLQARYAAALQEAILAKWTRPETVPVGAGCRLVIRQLPGGEVMSAEVASPCAYDEQGRRSIEAAVLKAQPLPYAGFETVFARTLTLNFEARDR